MSQHQEPKDNPALQETQETHLKRSTKETHGSTTWNFISGITPDELKTRKDHRKAKAKEKGKDKKKEYWY